MAVKEKKVVALSVPAPRLPPGAPVVSTSTTVDPETCMGCGEGDLEGVGMLDGELDGVRLGV